MSSLLESWDTIVVAISSFRGSEKLKFDKICDIVLRESIRKREIGDSSSGSLSVDQRGRSKSKGPNNRAIKIKEPGKISKQTKCKVLELWRKKSLLSRMYKDEAKSQIRG